jgi:hypothetical protein
MLPDPGAIREIASQNVVVEIFVAHSVHAAKKSATKREPPMDTNLQRGTRATEVLLLEFIRVHSWLSVFPRAGNGLSSVGCTPD